MMHRVCLIALFYFVMVACSPQQSAPESTIATRTLPPTWTSEPSPEPPATNTLPPPTQLPTPSPQIELTLAEHREGAADVTLAAIPTLPSGEGGKIAYSYADFIIGSNSITESYGINVMNADGTGVNPLVPGSFLSALNPAWSPDGVTLAYICWGGDICLINYDGTGERRLIETDQPIYSIAWHPDGLKLAYIGPGLSVYEKALTGGPTTLLLPEALSFSWSPDGSQIAYARMNDQRRGELFIRPTEGGEEKKVTDLEVTSVAWSPDGELLLISVTKPNARTDHNIYTIRPDGSDVRQLTDNDWNNRGPAWSPDGNQIIFSSDQYDHQEDIFVMNADGSDRRRLTSSEAWEIEPVWQPVP